MLFEGGKQTVVLYGGKLLQKGWKKSFYELLDKQSSNVVVVDRSVQPRPEWYWRDDTDPKKINNGKKERKKEEALYLPIIGACGMSESYMYPGAKEDKSYKLEWEEVLDTRNKWDRLQRSNNKRGYPK